MKTIVTHIRPDLDAIASSWLIKRFYPGWEEAGMAFVSAGSTFKNLPVDSDDYVLHVDTGLGKFDHHQTSERISATKKVYDYLLEHHHLNDTIAVPLDRMVSHITEIDNFAEVFYPDPTADRYEFSLSQIIEGLNSMFKDGGVVAEYVFILLDSILVLFEHKVRAEEELKNGFIFTSAWGKTLAIETKNEEVMKLALKQGYGMVLRKDPERGNVRIKTTPSKDLDLTKLYEKLQKADTKATWFLHSSKNILLNGSSKGPNMIPTSLPLKKVIEIIKEF